MKIKYLITLLLIISMNVQANTINLTIDSQAEDLCLAVENKTNYICDKNETMTLDGTKDYEYFFIMRPPLPNDYTYTQLVTYLITEPLILIIALGGFIAMVMIVAIIVYFIAKQWM